MGKITVLSVCQGRHPTVVEIEDSLESMQKMVGGYIELYMPFDDWAAIVCDDEAKLKSKPLNRAIYNSNGDVVDIIAGDFFIAYAPPDSEDIVSLPAEMIRKYSKLFYNPEMFF